MLVNFGAAVGWLSASFQMGIGFALSIHSIWLTRQTANYLDSWRWAFLVLVPGFLIGIFAMAALGKNPEAQESAMGNHRARRDVAKQKLRALGTEEEISTYWEHPDLLGTTDQHGIAST